MRTSPILPFLLLTNSLGLLDFDTFAHWHKRRLLEERRIKEALCDQYAHWRALTSYSRSAIGNGKLCTSPTPSPNDRKRPSKASKNKHIKANGDGVGGNLHIYQWYQHTLSSSQPMYHCFEISKDLMASAVLNLKTPLSSITGCLIPHIALLTWQPILDLL